MQSWKRVNTVAQIFSSSSVQESFVSFEFRRQYFRNMVRTHGISKNRSVLDEERCELSGIVARTEPCILGTFPTKVAATGETW